MNPLPLLLRFPLLLLAFGGPARASEIPEAAAYHQAVLAETSHAVENWSVVSGAMTIHFDKGSAAYLLVNGKPAGIYVKGSGTFRFLAKDPVMKPTLLFNLEENKGITPVPEGEGLVLGEPLSEGVIWFAGREVPRLEGANQPSLAASYTAAAAFFAERDQMEWNCGNEFLNRLPLGQLMAYGTLNGFKGPLCTAELVGAQDHYIYTYDPYCGKRESLFLQRSSHGPTEWVPTVVLVADPVGWAHSTPPDPDFRLAHVDLDLVASRDTMARMRVTETINVIRPGLRCLRFQFKNRRWVWSAKHGLTSMDTAIRNVHQDNGTELPFDQRGGSLLVDLGHQGRNGETIKVTFEIQGDFLSNESGGAFDYWRLPPGTHWIPEPEIAGRGYSVRARVAVEKPYIAIVSGKTLSRSSTATHNVVEAAMEKPICSFSVAAGRYESVEMVENNRTVRAWCYSSVPKTSDQLLKTTHAILEYYDQILGGVPFEEINLVEVPYLGFGQPSAGMIWLSREAFNPRSDNAARRAARTGPVGGGINRLLALELARQYWNFRVKAFSDADGWISESFAEYCAALVIKAMKGKEGDSFGLILDDWKRRGTAAASQGTIPTAHLMAPWEPRARISTGLANRANLRHAKGPYLLACLHQELGDQAFFRLLRIYQAKFAWYPPSYTQDFVDLLKTVSGKDYSSWMNAYFWGTAMPDLKK